MFLHILIRELLKKEISIVPIFINLPSLKNPVHNVINEYLTSKGLKESEIETLRNSNTELLLLLDGYDEIKKYNNIYECSNLSQWKNCKVIITCRQ